MLLANKNKVLSQHSDKLTLLYWPQQANKEQTMATAPAPYPTMPAALYGRQGHGDAHIHGWAPTCIEPWMGQAKPQAPGSHRKDFSDIA